MYTHQQIWQAIDRVAANHDWSLPQLALRAGLDPTALNPSKRFSHDSKPRWLTTETLAKILTAIEMSFMDFAVIVESNRRETDGQLTVRLEAGRNSAAWQMRARHVAETTTAAAPKIAQVISSAVKTRGPALQAAAHRSARARKAD